MQRTMRDDLGMRLRRCGQTDLANANSEAAARTEILNPFSRVQASRLFCLLLVPCRSAGNGHGASESERPEPLNLKALNPKIA